MSDINEMNVGPRWYVAHTYSGYENKVKASLEKIVENRGLGHMIFDIKIPVETVIEKNGDVEKEVEVKVFPSYVLIKMVMNDATRHIVRNIRGVTGFVGPDSQPVPLTDDEIKTLGVGVHKTFSVDYNVGDTVILVSGSMAGNTAIVKEIDPETGMVKATMLVGGREAVVEFEASAAEIFDV